MFVEETRGRHVNLVRVSDGSTRRPLSAPRSIQPIIPSIVLASSLFSPEPGTYIGSLAFTAAADQEQLA